MDIYTLGEVAKRLRISEPTARDLLRAGDLHAVRIGVQWRVTKSALDAYLSGAATPARSAVPRRTTRKK